MTPREIKTRLKEKGITQGDLRRRLEKLEGRKRSSGTISFLVNRKMTSAKLERWLARVLGVTLAELRGTKHRPNVARDGTNG